MRPDGVAAAATATVNTWRGSDLLNKPDSFTPGSISDMRRLLQILDCHTVSAAKEFFAIGVHKSLGRASVLFLDDGLPLQTATFDDLSIS